MAIDERLLGMLQYMVDQNASDLHIGACVVPYVRINGLLRPADFPALSAEDTGHLLFSIMSEQEIKQYMELKTYDFAYGDRALGRFRINVYQQRGSLAAAIRMLPCDPPTLEELGLPIKIVKQFCNLSHGLVLICGPVGTGKTTTLASIINFINRTRSSHIFSIEDPIEYVHQNVLSLVHQREVHRDTPNFTDALRYILREDPNIVVIGEMRDLETIASAITIAETGHLVFGTLHTGDASESISRMVDVFPPVQQVQISVQLAYALRGVINQVLLPKTDNSGRLLACEIMVVTGAIQNLIRENKLEQIYSHIQMGGEQGMQTMNQALAQLVKVNKITKEAAFSKTKKPQELLKLLER